jgi:hypothetical protein
MAKSRRTIRISDVIHRTIAGGTDLFCSHPLTGGIHNFGGGEIVIAYTEKECDYQNRDDVSHGEAKARLVLCRTLDGGLTWPSDLRQVLRDNREPFDDWVTRHGEPQPVDMTGPEAMFVFWRSFVRDPWATADGRISYRPVTYALRSTDRGYNWQLPPVIVPHYHLDSIYGTTNYLKLPNGDVLAAVGGYPYPPHGAEPLDDGSHGEATRSPNDEAQRRPSRNVLYVSKDQGLNWYFLSTIALELRDEMGAAYPALTRFSDGRLMCLSGFRTEKGVPVNSCWTTANFSDDDGLTWSEPKRINQLGDQANVCRLRDNRLVSVYGYRFVPYGLRGVVSEDEGKTWSEEFVIRNDGAGPDLGYPVVTELPSGQILVVYYFNVRDELDAKLLNGGRRHVACSTFSIM